MSVQIPRNLLMPDRVALGLTRGQLLTIAIPAAVAYGAWRFVGGALGLGAAMVLAAVGVVLALVPFDGSCLITWIGLAARWLMRREGAALTVDQC